MSQLVSILIPAFNAEKWIRSSIQSALGQTWPRKEIIVVDDGSRDATLRIAKSYVSTEVLLATNEHCGASAARNRALSLAQGQYIQWLDADDILAHDKIALQLNGAENGENSQILLSCSWGQFYHCPKKCSFTPCSLWENLEPVEWLFRKVDGNLWMPTASWLVSRRLTEMAGLWDESLSLDDDGEYFCRVVSCSLAIRFILEARIFVRKGTFGISNSLRLNDHKLESQAVSLLSYVRTLSSMEDSTKTRTACLKMLQRWGIFFYPERLDIWERMQEAAVELGGLLLPPKLPWKYQWLQRIFGWRLAKKAQRTLPVLRSLIKKSWERILCSCCLAKGSHDSHIS